MKRVMAVVIAAGLMTLGSVGVAAAQQGGGSTTPSSQPSGTSTTPPVKHRRAGISVLRVTAKTLGVKPHDLIVGLCGGKTLAQLANEHGKSAQDVINPLVQAAEKRIDAAAKRGRITSTQANQRKSQVQARVASLVNQFKPSAQRCQRLQSGTPTAPSPTA